MTMRWRPTPAEVKLIKQAAAREARIAFGSVILEPGYRYNTDDSTRPVSLNIALVSDNPDWEDTDLSDYGPWADFRGGVDLTADGRAIVDFYIRKRNDSWAELHGNISVTYAEGRIQRIRGYPGEYPTT